MSRIPPQFSQSNFCLFRIMEVITVICCFENTCRFSKNDNIFMRLWMHLLCSKCAIPCFVFFLSFLNVQLATTWCIYMCCVNRRNSISHTLRENADSRIYYLALISFGQANQEESHLCRHPFQRKIILASSYSTQRGQDTVHLESKFQSNFLLNVSNL